MKPSKSFVVLGILGEVPRWWLGSVRNLQVTRFLDLRVDGLRTIGYCWNGITAMTLLGLRNIAFGETPRFGAFSLHLSKPDSVLAMWLFIGLQPLKLVSFWVLVCELA